MASVLRSSSPEIRLLVAIDANLVPVREINHIQSTTHNSVKISDRFSRTYKRFSTAQISTKVGFWTHIHAGHRSPFGDPCPAASLPGELARRVGLWRQSERELIDSRAILAEHPLQSGGHPDDAR